ncbi:hypothetical protein [Micromonospora sp. LOL_023]|uniref:hypothetical protein n=1 Tax=Micromonospora sp. LOL_023 TaxID=3345418 RepID=UPI003A8BEFB3
MSGPSPIRVAPGVVRGVALGVVLLAGAAGQLTVWAAGNWLWNDETAIAINLRRDFLALTRGLEFQQVAPVGWLWLEKSLLYAFGVDERVLRLPSLAGMLAVLILTAVIAHRAGGRWAAVVATALIATAPMILTYVGELKQYAVEAAVTLALLLLAERVVSSLPARARWTRVALPVAGWVAVTLVAVFVSLTAVLALAGAVAGAGLVLAVRRRWRDALLLAAGAAPAVAFAGWLIHRRRQYPFMPGQADYFTGGTPPAEAGPAGILGWLPQMWAGFVTGTLHWHHPLLILALLLAGLAALLWRGRPVWAAMLGGVLLMAVLAAAARGLPLADRVATWLIAPTVLLVVAGLDGAARLARWQALRAATGRGRAARAALTTLAVLLVAAVVPVYAAPAAQVAYRQAFDPLVKDAGPAALADVARQVQPGDVVLFYWFSYRMIEWYGPQYGLAPRTVRLYPASHDNCDPQRLAEWIGDARRVWYVHGRSLTGEPRDYPQRVAAALAAHGTIAAVHTFPHDRRAGSTGSWLLVDLTAGPDPQPPPVEPSEHFHCLGRW